MTTAGWPATRDGRGDYIDGRFVRGPADDLLAPPSPAAVDDVPLRAPVTLAHVDAALAGATAAKERWRKVPAADRAALLVRYGEALARRREGIAVAIARSIGKPLWEARTEADALVAKVQITLGAGAELLKFPVTPEPNTRLRVRPVGVAVVLGPFNFPAHLANGHFVPALANGNCVVFKPSERAPEVGELLAECIDEAGFPPGVFQLVQGGAATAAALVADRRVDAVLFTGSTAVGSKILAASARYPGRLVALELGGRNPAIVLDDADLRHATREIAFSAFVTAGQRCTANSRVLVSRSVADAFVARLARVARATRVGPPAQDGPEPFLGPVIDAHARARILEITKDAKDFAPIVPAAPLLGEAGHFLAPSVYRAERAHPEGPLALDELFAPLVTVEVYEDDDALLTAASRGEYGLAAAVFTGSSSRFEAFADALDVGLCNWNRASVGSSSKLPFGGRRASGNHRPAGLFSTYYCVDAVAELHVPAPPEKAVAAPGLLGLEDEGP